MGKATQKSAPVSLGTKRSCPDCGTKFYDFNKDDLVCPKCSTKIDPERVPSTIANIPKRSKKDTAEEALMESEDVVVAGSEEAFESVDDLDDEEDDVAEDLNVDGESDEGDY